MRRLTALVLASCALCACSVYDSSLLRGAALSAAAGQSGSAGDSGGDSSGGIAGTINAGGTAGGSSADAGESGSGTSDVGGAAPEMAGAGGAPSAGSGGTGLGGSSAGAGGALVSNLALGKPVTASSVQPGNTPERGNDGDATTRWCAVDASLPQWWRVDLGATHRLNQVSLQFEHPERTYSYTIETSSNDSVYVQQAIINGTGALQTSDLPSNVSARYIRITVTHTTNGTVSGSSVPTWASFFEFTVSGY